MVKHDIDYTYIRPGKLKMVSEWAVPLVVFVGALSFYISKMAPSILWGDLTDFSAANYIFSPESAVIYPLYSFLSRLIILLPGMSPAFAANFMSAIFGAVSVALFYLIIKRLFQVPVMHWNYRNMPSYKKLLEDNPDYGSIDDIIDIERIAKPSLTEIPSFGAAVLFAISLPVWLASVRGDVYALQMALTMAGFYFVIEGIQAEQNRLFFLGVWFYSISFTNHPLIALAFAPAFLYLILANLGNLGKKAGALVAFILMLASALSVYIYLPVHRAFESMASAQVSPQSGLFSSIPILSGLGKIPLPQQWPLYLERLNEVVFGLAEQVEWPLIGLALIGLTGVYQLSRKVFTFLFLGLLFNLVFAVWFGEFHAGGYEQVTLLAPLTALTLILAISGTLYLFRTRLVAEKSSVYMTLLLGIFIYAAAEDNWHAGDLSRADGPERLSHALIDQLPQNALLVTADRNLIQPLWYYSYIEGSRNDLCIVSSDELQEPRVRRIIKERFPQLAYPQNFLENDTAYNDYFAADLCWRNAGRRDVFMQYGVYALDYRNVTPEGLLFRYIGLDTNRTYPAPSFDTHTAMVERLLEDDEYCDPRTADIAARWLYFAGLYYDNIGSREMAWDLYRRALSIDMTNTEMRIRMAGSLASSGKYSEALKYVSDALALEPNNPRILELGRRIVDRMNKKEEVAARE